MTLLSFQMGEKNCWEREVVITELTKGKELMLQLQKHFNPMKKDVCQYLAAEILTSYDKALSLLNGKALSGMRKGKEIINPASSSLTDQLRSPHLLADNSAKSRDLPSNSRRRNEAKTAKDVKDVPPTAGGVEVAGDTGGKLVHFDGGTMFSEDDLLCATADILGKSTYFKVCKATFKDGSQVALQRLRKKFRKGQKEFEKEAIVLGKIRHPNLLATRGYYLGTKREEVLIFDYMPKGSLANFLHARGPDTPIDWPTRMRIAKRTARGLLYLHTNANIIHGNLTSSNVLLDENTDAKIVDYGLSRLVTAAANSNVIATAGALGYRASELNKLKKANEKTDIYSLGVIILELLTGKSPSEAVNGVDLPGKVASIVKEKGTNEVFDLELMRDASIIGDELLITLKLALHCVDPSPSARPEFQQVLHQLEDIRRETPTAAPSTSH